MTISTKRFSFTKILDIFLLIVIFLLSFIHGERQLRNWHGPGGSITTDLYIPSIMFACGRGFVNAEPSKIPQLREFLDFNIQNFPKENIPPDLTPLELDQYQQYHRYLIYTTGLLWRVTGVSWESLRIFLAVLFSVTALITYLISRIYLHPPFAFFVALMFLSSPITVTVLPILRDFARAPFILGTILILCYMSSRNLPNRKMLAISVLLGVINGVGIGFRRDQLLFLILSILIMLLSISRKTTISNFLKRSAFPLITLLIFVICSFPILLSFYKYGTLGYHDILMGFGADHDDLAGLAHTNYLRIPKHNDLFVSALADVHSYYSSTFQEYESTLKINPEKQKRKLILAYAYWFPGDMIIRVYASVARILDKITTIGLPIHPYRLIIPILALVIFLTLDPQKAFPFILIIVYSCGIQTLQFNFRHNFYLSFLPSLLQMFLLQWVFALFYEAIKNGKPYIDMVIRESPYLFIRLIRNFSLLIVIVLLPLQIARIFQMSTVEKLFNTYITSELVGLPFEKHTLGEKGSEVYVLKKPLYFYLGEKLHLEPSFRLNYLAVDFNLFSPTFCFDVLYIGNPDFSSTLSIEIKEDSPDRYSPVTVRYYIPILETFFDERNWNRFIGIKIEDTSKGAVKNIYKICDEEKIPLPLFLYIAEKGDAQIHQQIARYSEDEKMINLCWRPQETPPHYTLINDATQKFNRGARSEAIQLIEEAFQNEPYYIQYLIAIGKLLEGSNDYRDALEIYKKVLKQNPYEPILGIFIDNLLKKYSSDGAQIENLWASIEEEVSECPIAQYFHAKHVSDKEKAKHILIEGISSCPELATASTYPSELFSTGELLKFLINTHSFREDTSDKKCSKISLKRQVSFLLSCATTLVEKGNFEKANEILNLLLNVCPELPLVYPPLVSIHTKGPSPNPFLATYYAKTLIELEPYKIDNLNCLENIYENTQFIPVNEWISIWEDLHQKHSNSSCILCGLGKAYEISGDIETAEKYYTQATKIIIRGKDCIPLAYFRLINLYISKNEIEKAQKVLNKALKKYPDNPNLLFLKSRIEQEINHKE